MKDRSTDRTELLLKLAATLIAAICFGVLAAGLLILTPRQGTDNFLGVESSKNGAPLTDVNSFSLPAPPLSEQMHAEQSEQADIFIYQSRLSREGLHRFYNNEMVLRGWEPGLPPLSGRDTREKDAVVQDTLYFTSGRHRCIINLEPKDGYITFVTLIISGK